LKKKIHAKKTLKEQTLPALLLETNPELTKTNCLSKMKERCHKWCYKTHSCPCSIGQSNCCQS